MSDVKTLYNNQLLLDLFLEEFGINPYLPKNKRRLHKLRRGGLIAASVFTEVLFLKQVK